MMGRMEAIQGTANAAVTNNASPRSRDDIRIDLQRAPSRSSPYLVSQRIQVLATKPDSSIYCRQGGQAVPVTAKILGMPVQTLGNWVRRSEKGQLRGAGDKPVSAEQMELARLRAENARLRMERDILKKATAYFARESL